jgi:hypothetical protein
MQAGRPITPRVRNPAVSDRPGGGEPPPSPRGEVAFAAETRKRLPQEAESVDNSSLRPGPIVEDRLTFFT